MNANETENITDSLLEWLKSPECFDILLKQIAPLICFKEARKRGINLGDIGIENDVHEVASCLWEFLCNKQETLHDLNSIIASGNSSKLVSIIINRFFNYCIDERRSSSPYHAYYEHIRKVLQKEHKAYGIQYESNKVGSFYAWSQEKNLGKLQKGEIAKDSFKDWPRPEISASDIHKKSQIISLSKFFWQEVTRRKEREYLIPIYDLTNYVSNVYGITKLTEYQKNNSDEEDSNDCLARIEDKSPSFSPSRAVIEQQLKKRADMLVNFWDTKERRLFLLIFDQAMTLENTAKELDYKSAAAADYQKKKLISAIRESWDQWQFDYSPGDDHIEDEQKYFYEMLVHFCKFPD